MSLDSTISLTTLNAVKASFSVAGLSWDVGALWLYCPAVGATAATAEVTDTTLVLIITGGASAGTTTLTFADTDSDTMTELVAKINAASGWKAGLLYHPSAASTDLIATGAVSCLTAANQITLIAEANYTLNDLINRASQKFESYCNRNLKSRDYSREIYYGSGYTELMLDQYPVTRVSRLSSGRANACTIRNTTSDMDRASVEITSTIMRLIVEGGASADDTELTLADYTSIDLLITAIEALGVGWSCSTIATDTDTRNADELLIRPAMYVDATARAYCEIPDEDITEYKLSRPTAYRNMAVLTKPSAFCESVEYFVSYTAGYVTIPYDLEEACLEYVKFLFTQASQDTGMKSETKGDYKYERMSVADFVGGMPPGIATALNFYKKYHI